jgi:hypothetical protein
MKNIKTLTVSLIFVIASVLLLPDNIDARADYAWSVGSQLSQIAASDNSVYVLWQNNLPDQNVYFRRSTDGGGSFDKTIQLSNAVSTGYASDPLMAVSGNNVYIAWMERQEGANHSVVLFRRSTDGGATFEDAQILGSNSKGDSGIQQLSALGNNVYALIIDEWAENGSYYYNATFKMSKDDGKTFGEPVSLLPGLSYSNIRGVTSIATSPSGDMVYAVGVDYGDCRPNERICDDYARIFFKRSTDGGNTFSEDKTIERPPGIVMQSTSERRAIAPAWVQVAATNKHVGIVWGESPISSEQGSIFLVLSRDGGETFGAPVALDADAKGGSDWPLMLSTPDSMYVAWNARQDNHSMPYIGLTRINSDSSFTQPINATGKSGIPNWDVAISDNNVFVVASNYTKNTAGLPDGVDVYFHASTDNGDSFEVPVALSDDDAIKTLLAAQQKSLSFVNAMLATSGQHVYVGWQTSYPDSHEIFIRASDDGGRTFGRITSLNEETGEPVSKGLSILTSSSAVYVIVIMGAIAAGAFGILAAKRRGGTR